MVIEVTPTQFILIIVGLIVIFFLLVWWIYKIYKKRSRRDSFDYEYIKSKSQLIEKLLNGESESEYSLALIEADKLLDFLLKSWHFAGNTLGERLKVAGYRFPELRKVWPAHKMRNRIVHESSAIVTQHQAKSYWKDYQKAYRILIR